MFFSAKSTAFILVSIKLKKNKRYLSDFRHINARIVQTNLGFSLVRDIFTMSGSPDCEVLLVINLKDAFDSLRLTEDSKKHWRILAYFGSTFTLYERMPIGLNISPDIWQSYSNAILDCLQNTKYCKVIIDDLWLFTQDRKSHTGKVEYLLKVLLKNGQKISPKNANC